MKATNRSSWKLNVKFSTFGMKTEKKNFRAPPSPVPHPLRPCAGGQYGLWAPVRGLYQGGGLYFYHARSTDFEEKLEGL